MAPVTGSGAGTGRKVITVFLAEEPAGAPIVCVFVRVKDVEDGVTTVENFLRGD